MDDGIVARFEICDNNTFHKEQVNLLFICSICTVLVFTLDQYWMCYITFVRKPHSFIWCTVYC